MSSQTSTADSAATPASTPAATPASTPAPTPASGPASAPPPDPAANTPAARPPDAWRLSWERVTVVPLALAAFAFLAAYAIPIAWPTVDAHILRACTITMQVAWISFLVDYQVRLLLSRRKLDFFLRNLLDLAILALPAFHVLRMLRLVALLSIIDRAGARTLRGRVVTYATAITVLVFFVGSLALTQAERGASGAEIKNLGDAFWFSITTMTTVGYGDDLPVTTVGKVISAVLMITGLAMLGTVTATLASYIVSKVAADPSQLTATQAQVQRLELQVAALRRDVGEQDVPDPDLNPDIPHHADRLAAGIARVEHQIGRIPLPRSRQPWIERHVARAVVTLGAMAFAVLVGLSALIGVASGGRDTDPTAGEVKQTIAGMPHALAYFSLGVVIILAIGSLVAWLTLRHPDGGPGWLSILTALALLTAYATTTMVLVDETSATALVASLALSFPFVTGVIIAMAYAQSRPPMPGQILAHRHERHPRDRAARHTGPTSQQQSTA